MKAQGAPVAGLPTKPRKQRGPKLLVMLGLSALPIFMLTFFLQSAIFSSTGFANSLTPLATSPALQASLSDQLSSLATNAVITPGTSETAAIALKAQAHAAAQTVVHDPGFVPQWIAIETSVHDQLMARLDNADGAASDLTITADVSPLARLVLHQMSVQGLTSVGSLPAGAGEITVVTLTAQQLSRMQSVYADIQTAQMLAAGVMLGTLLLALAISKQRIRLMERIAAGGAVQMAIFLALLAAARFKVGPLLATPDSIGAMRMSLYDSFTSQLSQLLVNVGILILSIGIAAVLLDCGKLWWDGRSETANQKGLQAISEGARILGVIAILIAAGTILEIRTPDPGVAVDVAVAALGTVIFTKISGRMLAVYRLAKLRSRLAPATSALPIV